MKQYWRWLCALALIGAGHLPAGAAETGFPIKPITMIVPFTAGGFTDVLARRLAEHMSTTLGQQVIVMNKAGASGAIGAADVAKSAPDGYTILMETPDTMVVNPLVQEEVTYDAVRDFDQISLLVVQPMVLVVSQKADVKSMAELKKRAASSQGSLTYASWGSTSTAHLAFATFTDLAGIKMNHIPYKGVSAALTDVIAGRVDAMFVGMMTSHDYADRLRPLAIAADQRSPARPELPTFQELGMAMPNLSLWYALGTPAGTPAAVKKRLWEAATAATKEQDIYGWLTGYGMNVVNDDPAHTSQFIKDEIPRWTKAAQAAKITLRQH